MMRRRLAALAAAAGIALAGLVALPADAVNFTIRNGGTGSIRYCVDRLTTSSSTAVCPSGNRSLAPGASASAGSFYYGSGYAYCYRDTWLPGPRWYGTSINQTLVPERWPTTKTCSNYQVGTPTPTPTPTPTTPPTGGSPQGGYTTLDFSDDFDGTTLDSAKWGRCWFPFSYSGDVCGRMNGSETLKSNVRVAGGSVFLKQSTATSDNNDDGALISTDPEQAGTSYGQNGVGYLTPARFYAEARVKFPGNGTACYNWPAWWINGMEGSGTAAGGNSGYKDGEIDVAEILGQGTMTSNYHSEDSSGAHVANNSGRILGSWCDGQYHVYGVDQRAGENRVYFDGQLVRTYSTRDGGAPKALIFNTGYTDELPQAGAELAVDYVKVWR